MIIYRKLKHKKERRGVKEANLLVRFVVLSLLTLLTADSFSLLMNVLNGHQPMIPFPPSCVLAWGNRMNGCSCILSSSSPYSTCLQALKMISHFGNSTLTGLLSNRLWRVFLSEKGRKLRQNDRQKKCPAANDFLFSFLCPTWNEKNHELHDR